MSIARHPSVDQYARHVNPAFVKLLGVFGYGRVFVRAKDVWIWDAEGRQYLDFLAGFGSASLGHNHPRLIARIKSLLDEEPLAFCHAGPSVHAAELAAALAGRVPEPLGVSLFTSGGGEAVEAAMKLARAATGRPGFVSCVDGFHGTSLGTLSIQNEKRMRAPFEPLLDGCVRVPFGDIAALEKALAPKTAAAFIVEPILGEGGVVFPAPGYLQSVRELCTKTGTLLVFDEVQTGLGRTGTLFAGLPVVPDVLVLAKALSGGIAPLGVAITSPGIHAKAYGAMDRFDLHATTFGGNALCCAAGLETLRIVDDEKLCDASRVQGDRLLAGLKTKLAGHPLVKDIRGRGLFVGIEIGPTESGWMNRLAPSLVSSISEKVFGQWASLKLLEDGILCQPASHRWDVLKLEPPLTIQAPEIDRMIDAVGKVFAAYQGIPKLLADVTLRLGTQAGKGFAWG